MKSVGEVLNRPETDREGGRMPSLYVWIGIRPDGSESMLSTDIPFRHGVRFTPLLSGRQSNARRMAILARLVKQESKGTPDFYVRIELRRYAQAETLPT